MRSSLSVSGSVTLRNVCAWNVSSASGLIELVSLSTAMMMCVRGHAAGMRIGRVILQSFHFRALEDLHAVIDQQVLERLQAHAAD